MIKNNLFESTIPLVDISGRKEIHNVTDKELGVYIGHPDTVVLEDGTLCTFYPRGHGKGEIIFKKSLDNGKKWSARQPLPQSFETSMETPTVYIIEPIGKPQCVLLISGMPYESGGFRTAWSYDGCKTFSELKYFYDDIGIRSIVAHSSLTRLKDNSGYIDKWMGVFHDEKFNNWKTFLTFDKNGEEQWSRPERLLEAHDEIEKTAQLCEIEVVRSPDGKELALLARAQKKITNAMVAFSTDEGENWTCPEELPRTLMGERHKACYNKSMERLVITYRDIIRNQQDDSAWLAGSLMAWVGRYEDLHGNREGDYAVLLCKDHSLGRGGDCGYAGNVLAGGDDHFVVTSYGHWDEEMPEESYVMTTLLNLDETDKLAINK